MDVDMFSSAVQLDTETLENDNYWTDRRTGGSEDRLPSPHSTRLQVYTRTGQRHIDWS